VRRTILTATAVVAAVVGLPGVASAEETTVVTTNDVSTCSATKTTTFCEFERGAGTVAIGAGSVEAAFGGTDHLLLDTPLDTKPGDPGFAKATVFSYDFAGKLLADIDTLGYSSHVTRESTANADQAPALNIEIDRNGGKLETGDYATLVWEPVYVEDESSEDGSTEAGVWLTRSPSTADGGWWSNANGTTTGVSGALEFPSYTADWASVQDSPALVGATVLRIGVNQGSGNQGLASEVDLLRVNDTVYDFESARTPVAKADCKGNNWTTFNEPTFRNQGECVSSLMSARSGR
jgi:hypothetical protein